ncbi:MAG: phosphoribosylformylglycinamidine cyclo-ligase [Firmicutes bacterium]|nr:phosphoribosylformylglycinamidine cyclo-ligase [Bacillota bacterium]
MGLVADVFDPGVLSQLPGHAAIGHVRYSTTGSSSVINAQPLLVNCSKGQVALAHNGNLVNAAQLRQELANGGAVFQTSTDSEVILTLLARYSRLSLEDALVAALQQVRGAYALVVLGARQLIGVRDPLGIRPLALGRVGRTYLLASETCVLSNLGATWIQEVEPGEMVIIDSQGVRFRSLPGLAAFGASAGAAAETGASAGARAGADAGGGASRRQALCVFEYIYFARPDSVLAGANVHQVRQAIGAELAREAPVEADVVIAAPDSGVSAAMGYAQASGIPYQIGLVKNRYVGRTFIQPSAAVRSQGVNIKLTAVEPVVRGRRVILIDDSVVRGTTSAKTVALLRQAGASQVHLLVASPAYRYPCFYGIDTSQAGDLIAARRSVEEVRQMIGADSLHYLSEEGLVRAVGQAREKLCLACFNGQYPLPVEEGLSKDLMEPGHGEACQAESPSQASDGGTPPPPPRPAYEQSGVDVTAGYEAVRRIKPLAARTFRPEVLTDLGSFGGAFAVPQGYRDPVLIAGADGVGTKLKVAFLAGRHDTIGIDCVAMCVNDVLAQGAEPLFFLDYVATGKLRPEQVEQIVRGIADGCQQAGCALLGGETAEMPGFYPPGEYDVAGFAVGIVERSQIIDGQAVRPGDVLLGLASSGLHSNGFSLVRKLVFEDAGLSVADWIPELGRTVGEELLVPTRIYVPAVRSLQQRGIPLHGIAHITGGGLWENLPRALSAACQAVVYEGSWPVPAVFRWLAGLAARREDAGPGRDEAAAGKDAWGRLPGGAGLSREELLGTFNMGIGMILILPPESVEQARSLLAALGQDAWVIGCVERRQPGDLPVRLVPAQGVAAQRAISAQF